MAKESATKQQQQQLQQQYPQSPLAQGSQGSYPSSTLKSPSLSIPAGYSLSTPVTSPGQIPQSKSSASLSSYTSVSSTGSYNPVYDSRGALDPRINMEEYAYNKVFVGGLHYDTRDGECTVASGHHQIDLPVVAYYYR